MSTPEQYRPKTLLVTGAAGFIMSHVVDEALRRYPQCRVIVLDVMDYCATTKNLEAAIATGRCHLVRGDVCNMDLVMHVLETELPDTIIHGAAASHVDLSFKNSLRFTRSNVLGTHVMLEAMRKHNHERGAHGHDVRRFIYIGTDEVYGSVDEQCHERSLKQPTNPYSASKAAASSICNAYMRSYGMPIIETRGNNTIGPRQYPEKLIPKFVTLIMQGKAVPIHGEGDQKRSLIDVEDCARAILTVLERGVIHEVYNIEAGMEMTVTGITEKLLSVMGVPQEAWSAHVTHVRDRDFNDKRYFIDGSKLRALGFKARVGLDESLRRIVDWYRVHTNYWPNSERALVAHPELTDHMC